MSKLSRLLKELCPEGVEYKTLGEIASISRGGNFQKKHYVSNGVPCIHYGQIYTKYNLFVNETDSYIDSEVAKKQKFAEPGDIIMAVTSENVEDVCKSIAWLGNDRIAVSGHTAIIHHNQNPKYLVYYLSSQMFQDQKRKIAHGTKVIEVSPAKLNEVKVAVPPLEIQREIVHILDSFTLLTVELTEKLTAELTARRKQYEFYRDKLLTSDMNISMEKIGDLTDVFSAARVHRNEWTSEGVRFWRSSDVISAFNGVKNSRGCAYISNELYENLIKRSGKIQKGDVLVTGGGTIGIPYVVSDDEPLYVKDADIIDIKRCDRLDSRYLYHYFLSSSFRKYLSNISHGATISHYTISQVKETPVPVPNIEIQKRIARVLDNFETICIDLNIGLPAEIEARQKQYEYYRDVLLTFAETGKTILTDRQTDRQTDRA